MNYNKCEKCGKFISNEKAKDFRFIRYYSASKEIIKEGYYCKKHGGEKIKELGLIEKPACTLVL